MLCVCVRACVHAYVRACVYVCMCVCVPDMLASFCSLLLFIACSILQCREDRSRARSSRVWLQFVSLICSACSGRLTRVGTALLLSSIWRELRVGLNWFFTTARIALFCTYVLRIWLLLWYGFNFFFIVLVPVFVRVRILSSTLVATNTGLWRNSMNAQGQLPVLFASLKITHCSVVKAQVGANTPVPCF